MLKAQAENINILEPYTKKNSVRIDWVDDRNEKETSNHKTSAESAN